MSLQSKTTSILLPLCLLLLATNLIFAWQQHRPRVATYHDDLAREISFKYPDTWHVYTSSYVAASGLTTIQLGINPLGDCRECGGYFGEDLIDISLIHYPIRSQENPYQHIPTSVEDVITSIQDRSGSSPIQQTEILLPNGVLTTVTPDTSQLDENRCDAPGGCRIPIETLVFVPNTNTSTKGELIVVERNWKATSKESEAGWNLMKQSLDFSRIK